ncbi:MAG: hypothetical protein WC389_18930 [Lutibacter sp.]
MLITFNAENNVENSNIVIDDIDGTVHKILGALPNMVFIIDANRKVIFKKEWNNAKSLQNVIQQFKTTNKILQQKWTMIPFPNFLAEYRVFKRAGWNARLDFILALPKLLFSYIIGGLCGQFPRFC